MEQQSDEGRERGMDGGMEEWREGSRRMEDGRIERRREEGRK